MNKKTINILMIGAALGVSIGMAFATKNAQATTLIGVGDIPKVKIQVIDVSSSAQEEGAKNFIASMGDRGINFLGNKSLSESAKKAEFSKLLNDSFDMNTIARFALGSNWKTATPAQQKEYLSLFNKMIVKVYSKRFSDYEGQKFEVKSARAENAKDSIVTSFIVPSDGAKVQVDWRVRNKGGSYKVIDILVEGVSMSQTQRSDFASVIQRGGGKIDVLLDHLKK